MANKQVVARRFRNDRLKALRLARALSQHELASRTDTHASNINRYEVGDSEPVSSTLASLADALDVTSDYLLGRDGLGELLPQTLVAEALELHIRYAQPSETVKAKLRLMALHPKAHQTREAWQTEQEMFELANPAKRPRGKPPANVRPLRRNLKAVPPKDIDR